MQYGVIGATHVMLHSVPEGPQFFVGTRLEVGSIHNGENAMLVKHSFLFEHLNDLVVLVSCN